MRIEARACRRDFEDAEGFDVSGIGELLENVLVLGFVRWRVAQPPNVRRQNFSSFLRYVLAPPLELRFAEPMLLKREHRIWRGAELANG